MEVRVLAGNPVEETRQRIIGQKRLPLAGMAGQLGIGEARVDRAVADGMERHGISPAPAFGHLMVPFDPPAQRAQAEPAAFRVGAQAFPLARARSLLISHRPDSTIIAAPSIVTASGWFPKIRKPSTVATSSCT